MGEVAHSISDARSHFSQNAGAVMCIKDNDRRLCENLLEAINFFNDEEHRWE